MRTHCLEANAPKSSTLKRYTRTGPIINTIYLSALPKGKINYFYGQKLESD